MPAKKTPRKQSTAETSLVQSLDLNLLVVFDALMADRNLTAAARRLGKTQSAVSHALKRLRNYTGEQLFERTRNGVRPTPRAIDMESDVRRALTMIHAALHQGASFDPASEDRTFLIDIPAGFDWILAPKIAETLSSMPKVTLRIANARAGNLLNELRFRETWLALDYMPLNAAGYRAETLIDDDIILIARHGHPKLKRGIDPKSLGEMAQVGVGWPTLIQPVNHPLDERIQEVGLPRNVRMWVPTLASMYNVVESTDLIAYAIRRPAMQFAKTHRFQTHELPVRTRTIPMIMVWHETFDNDPGHRWLRDSIREICASI